MIDPQKFELLINPRHGVPGVTVLPASGFRRAKAAITGWSGYAPTPLRTLPAIADVSVVRIKDEGSRFGLGSFKALGGAYAVANLLTAELARRNVASSATPADLVDGRYRDTTQAITVTCATDGNHGRSVAWGAERFHCRCVIFVHETVSQGRVDAIARFGAQVVRVPGNYDDAVREADRQARAQEWFVVSDTSYPGYTEVPRDVMQGYRLMADEAADQWSGAPPTHVFIQAGVGGAAAAVSVQMRARFTPAPLLVVVEPDRCGVPVGQRAGGGADGRAVAIWKRSWRGWRVANPACWRGRNSSGRPSRSCRSRTKPRSPACGGWRRRDTQIGELGVAGLAGLLLAAADPAAREKLRLARDSRVLLFGTEGVTDPVVYDDILHSRQS